MGVAVRKPGPTEPLTLTLAVGEPPTLSGLSSLSGVAGGHDAGEHLPDGCGDGPVVLRDLTVDFDPTTYEPSQVHLDVLAHGPWALPEIPGLDLHDVVLVAHSVASMMAVLAGAAEPSRFSRLVLVAPSPRYLDDEGYEGGFAAEDVDELLGAVVATGTPEALRQGTGADNFEDAFVALTGEADQP